jgi:hypothetical protein
LVKIYKAAKALSLAAAAANNCCPAVHKVSDRYGNSNTNKAGESLSLWVLTLGLLQLERKRWLAMNASIRHASNPAGQGSKVLV